MRPLIPISIISLTFLLFPAQSNTGEVYRWHDESGKLYIVDDIQKVPPQYRKQREEKPKTPPKRAAPSQDQAVPEVKSPISGGNYTLSVASFREKTRADRYVDELGRQGIEAFQYEVTLPEKGIWHRVCVGRFSTIREALLFGTDLEEKGFENFVAKLPRPEP
jgi:cell division septation protein DedD